jgi:hypothetical protein
MTDEEHKGVVASITSLGEKALGALPPALIVLMLLNVAFLFIDWQQSSARERILQQIIAGCLKQ